MTHSTRARGISILVALIVMFAPLARTALAAPAANTVFSTDTPGRNNHPTLADFWNGNARFVQDIIDTGLPMGESDTVMLKNGELLSYLHANSGSGVTDSCNAPTSFPGCVVTYRSLDRGRSFQPETNRCLIPCRSCPCRSEVDHSDQQQYPRIGFDASSIYMAYEYRGHTYLRRSPDGRRWSEPQIVPLTGVRMHSHRPCTPLDRVGPHPFAKPGYECLLGGPPGLFVENGEITVFVAQGQNPAHMACLRGYGSWPVHKYTLCKANPLLKGAQSYGPLDATGRAANPYFDHRTISSAEVVKIGTQYYALYEGIRGPGPGDVGDNQFGIGLARTTASKLDGPWEKFPGSPIIQDLPGNIGLGHADLIVIDGQTFLYTSLNGWTRGRMALVWR